MKQRRILDGLVLLLLVVLVTFITTALDSSVESKDYQVKTEESNIYPDSTELSKDTIGSEEVKISLAKQVL